MDSSKDNCSVTRERLPRASAVIVASRPFERPESVTGLGEDQQVLPALIRIGKISLIERVIIRLQTAGIAPIVVITGFKNSNLEKHLVRMNVVSLHNPHWRSSTLFDDAIKGLSYIDRTCRDCEKIFLMTPLIPSVDTTTLTRLLVSPSSVAVPVYEGEDGLPIVIRKDTVQQLARAEKGQTFEELITLVPGRSSGSRSTIGGFARVDNDGFSRGLRVIPGRCDEVADARALQTQSRARQSLFWTWSCRAVTSD